MMSNRTFQSEGRSGGLESLEYSPAVAQAWLDALKPSLPGWKFVSFRRSLALVEDAARKGSVTNVLFSYDRRVGKRRAPECFGRLLDAYLERRGQIWEGDEATMAKLCGLR